MIDLELWGIGEIADALDVTASLVHRWIREGRFPDPFAELRMGKVWLAGDVRAWDAQRRLSPHYRPRAK